MIEETAEEVSREEEQAARSTLRYVGRFAVVLLVVAGVGFAIVKQIAHLPSIDWHFRAGWLAFAAFCFATLQFIHAAIWRVIVRRLHGDLQPTRSRAIWSTSNMGKYVPTSLLAFGMRMTMADRVGVPKRVTAASVVYELALLSVACLVVGAYGVVQLPELQGHAVRWLVIVAPLAGIAAVHPRVFRPVADRLLRRIGREPLPETLQFADILLLCAAYAGSLLVAGAGTYAFASGLHHVAAGEVPTVFASFAIALGLSYVGFLLPAGLGAREAGFTAALAPALPTGVALAVAVGVRLLQMGIEVLYALITPVVAARRNV